MIRMWDKFEGVKAAGKQTNTVPTYVPYAHSEHSSNSWSLYECGEQDIKLNRNASADCDMENEFANNVLGWLWYFDD